MTTLEETQASPAPERHSRSVLAKLLTVTFGPLLVVAVVSACSSDDDDGEASPPTSAESTVVDGTSDPVESTTSSDSDTSGSSPGTEGGPVDAFGANDIALAEAPGSVVVEIDEDTEGGVAVWEVVVLEADGPGTEILIEVATGAVVRREGADLDDEERSAPAVTARAAMETATGSVPGVVTDLNLDEDDDRIVWEVDVRPSSGPSQDITIDTTTGAILDQDDDDGDDDDD